MAEDWGITINYNIFQLILALLLAVGLAFISSIFSIVKISKIPVKEIVNKLDSVKSAEQGVFKFLLAICLLILAVIIPRIIPFEYALISDIICTLVAISSVVLLVPYFSIVLVNIVDLVFSLFFGNVGVLAKRNVKSDKNIITNISLLCVAIASILMIVILTRSALEEMTNYYSKTPNFDIMAIVDNMDENFEKKVYSLGDVKYAGCTYSARDIEVRGKSEGITQIEGTYGDEIFKYWNLLIYGDKKKIISELGNGRNIVLNVMLKDRYKVDIGDDIVLKMKKGYRNYKVIGFMNTSIEAGTWNCSREIFKTR